MRESGQMKAENTTGRYLETWIILKDSRKKLQELE